MSANDTGRMQDSDKAKIFKIRGEAQALFRSKIHRKWRQWGGFLKVAKVRATKCSQCGLGMDPYIAKLQRENKRENAPICIPCIEGKKRTPKTYEK